jgi:hypothetical protein
VIASINQPAYLPWLGYFDRILRSDVHIVLDHVQFEKNSFTNRNKVRTPDGWTWLSVPVQTKGRFGDLAIDRLEVANERPWARKHWDTLRFNYRRATHFGAEAPFWEEVYGRRWDRLLDLQRTTLDHTLGRLGIATPLLSSAALGVGGAKDELVLNLCRHVGATVYLSGPLGRDYLVPERFAEAGIELRFHDFAHPTYPQAHPGFEPYMAALDALLCLGASGCRELLEDPP